MTGAAGKPRARWSHTQGRWVQLSTDRRRHWDYCPEYSRARTYAICQVNLAKRFGMLPQLDGAIACVDCGRPAQVYDHRDYDKPLVVDAVCQSCNVRRGPALWSVPPKRTTGRMLEVDRLRLSHRSSGARG